VIYLNAVGGACFLYVPFIILADGTQEPYIAYSWVWNVRLHFTPNGFLASWYDYNRVALEGIGLTAIAGVLLLIGSFVEGRKRGQRSDPPIL
jgi:hypothetical protein